MLGALDVDAWARVAAEARGQKQGQFEVFLRTLRPAGARPALFFEHAILPHSPWRFLPSGRAYPDADAVSGIDQDWSQWGSSRVLVDTALQRHLLQVRYTDRLLGLALRRLEKVGLYDRALLVVTADHGVSFEPNGYMRAVTPANLADIAGVPLFVKYPGQQRGSVDNRDATTIDIVPTIADVLGVPIPWHVDGRSLHAKPLTRRVSVAKGKDEPVDGDPGAVHAGVLATARRNAALFGEGNGSMFRIGPFTELLGRSSKTLSTLAARSGVVRLNDPTLFADVQPGSGLVPVRVAGELSGRSVPPGTALAVAVNGRVAATTKAYALDGRNGFAVILPEGSFRKGANAVEVYAVALDGSRPRLRFLGGVSPVTAPGVAPAVGSALRARVTN